MTTINSKTKPKNNDGLETIMGKFHKDFRLRTDEMLGYMKYHHDILSQQAKIARFSSTTQVGASQNIGDALSSPNNSMTKQIVKSNSDNKKGLKELSESANAQMDLSKKQHEQSKSLFKSAMVQLRIFDVVVANIKKLMSGPSETERTIHAINNVERAVRKQKSKDLDERSLIQKILEGKEGILSIFPELRDTLHLFGVDTSKFESSISDSITSFRDFMVSGKDSMGTAAKNVAGSVLDAMNSNGVKSKATSTGEKFSGSFVDIIDKLMGGALTNKFVKSKSATLGATVLFGSMFDNMLAGSIMRPLDAIKFSMKGALTLTSALINNPLYSTIPLMTSQFGLAGGAVALFMKTFKPFTYLFGSDLKDLGKDLGSVFGGMFKKIKKSSGEYLESLGDSVSKLKGFGKAFKKKMGKTMLGLGVWLGIKGTAMLGVMGTIMTVGMAALPYILGAAAVAAIGFAGKWIYDNWDTVKEKWTEFVVDPFISMVTGIASSISSKVTEVKDSIVNIFTSIFEGVIKSLTDAVKSLPYGLGDLILGDTPDTTDVSGSIVPVKRIEKANLQTSNNGNTELIEIQKKQLKQTEMMNEFLSKIEKKEAPPIMPNLSLDDQQTMVLTR